MTLTVRDASVTGAVTAGRELTHAEMDANWAHVIDSSNQSFTQSGTGATSTNLQTRGRLVVYAQDYGCVGDSSTNNSSAIAAAMAAVNAAGGGDIYFPAGQYNTGAALTPVSNVRLFGTGPKSKIYCTANDNVVLAVGPQLSTYAGYTYYTLSAISAGDRTLTFSTTAEAANFAAGDLAFVRDTSTDAGGAGAPIFVEMVKVSSVDTGAGTVTLEDPITVAVSSPEITKTSHTLVENFGIEDMNLETASTNSDACLRIRALYRGFFRRLTLKSNGAPLLGNALTKSVVEDIDMHFKSATSGVLEWKTGAYANVFRNIRGWCYGAITTIPNVIGVGEYARDITFENISIYMRDSNVGVSTGDAVITNTSTHCSPLRVRNVKVWAKDIYAVVRCTDGDTTQPYGTTVEDVDVFCNSFARGVSFTSVGGSGVDPKDCIVRGVRINGTNTNNINADAAYGIYLQNDMTNGEISNCVIPGVLKVDTTRTYNNMRVIGNAHNGISWTGTSDSTQADDIIYKGNTRLAAGSLYTQMVNRLVDANITTTTANTVYKSFTMAAAAPFVPGDEWMFDLRGGITGTNGQKNIVIADDTGAALTIAVAAANTGAFSIQGKAYILDNARIRIDLTHIAPGIALTATEVIRGSLDLATNGRKFEIQAWLANASDAIFFDRAIIKMNLLGD